MKCQVKWLRKVCFFVKWNWWRRCTWSQRWQGASCWAATLVCVISEVIKWRCWWVIVGPDFVVFDEAFDVGWHLCGIQGRAAHGRIWKSKKIRQNSGQHKDPQCAGQNKMARNFKIADFTYMTLELWWVWVMSGNDEGGVRPSYWGRLQGFVKAWCQRRSCHLRRRLHPRNWWYFPEHRHQGSGIWSELRVCDCTRRTQGLVLKWD